MSKTYTNEQQFVINFPQNGAPMQNMLVSASAGTGKTTVMIERIARLIKEGVNVDQIIVVTFTNLAAAEMKNRLFANLSQNADSQRVREQLEKLDTASICTLHSFCSDVLRNYFYVVDIDPAFSILDTITSSNLKKSAMDDLFREYFSSDDAQFQRLYQIYATGRKEENFKDLLFKLHAFSRNMVDFGSWYQQKREIFASHKQDGNAVQTILKDIKGAVNFCKNQFEKLNERCLEENGQQIAQICQANADMLSKIDLSNLESAVNDVCKLSLEGLVPTNRKAYVAMDDKMIEDKIREDFKAILKTFADKVTIYSNLFRGNHIDVMWQEMDQSLQLTDKLVEMVNKFEDKFFALKKQRGGVDFNDLEHLMLKVLSDEETARAIKERYKLVFVDEYQDTNPVQEAIISALSTSNNLFMVGDVKQSIYGFRGCEPGIFIDKYNRYQVNDGGVTENFNDNFRSNKDILDFVNVIFNDVMTDDFGKVNYKKVAQLKGKTPPTLTQTPSVMVNFVQKVSSDRVEICDYYDITRPTEALGDATQAKAIAKRIKRYVGMAYKDKDGNAKRIEYGDIVILLRSMTAKAVEIHNALVSANIPVTASFKVDGFASKEVRELVNLLRVIDNPYNDVYLVGVCLCAFGKFTETELAKIRLSTSGVVPFYDRLNEYARLFDDEISAKITKLLNFVENLRFYSHGVSVCDVVLQAIKQTDYNLFVEGLPNGALRLNKLNAFVDGLKGATYAESIDKFLYYIDETEEARAEQALANTNAVRIMTMHASKGLEFPIVILAGLEGKFNFDSAKDTHYVEKNNDMGVCAYFYDFDHMKRYQTLGSFACSLYNKQKQREEEMRLLYVAMTRPKFVLDIFATASDKKLSAIPPAPENANSFLDWVLYSLKGNFPNMQSQTPCVAIDVIGEEDMQTQGVSQQLLCEQQSDENAVLQTLAYAYPYQSQTQMPTKIVSSALDKQYIDDEESVTAPVIVQDDKNKVGTAYHTVYQFVNYDANLCQIEYTIKSLVEQGKIESQYADQLDANLIFATLQNPQLKEILRSGEVYHEMPFMLYAPYDQIAKDKRFSDQVILQGVIDLLVLYKDKAVVVDFKYTSRSDKVAERYPYQLNSYKLAVQQICGIDKVDAYVLSIADNKLIKMQ